MNNVKWEPSTAALEAAAPSTCLRCSALCRMRTGHQAGGEGWKMLTLAKKCRWPCPTHWGNWGWKLDGTHLNRGLPGPALVCPHTFPVLADCLPHAGHAQAWTQCQKAPDLTLEIQDRFDVTSSLSKWSHTGHQCPKCSVQTTSVLLEGDKHVVCVITRRKPDHCGGEAFTGMERKQLWRPCAVSSFSFSCDYGYPVWPRMPSSIWILEEG
jgi:hypothetical protein